MRLRALATTVFLPACASGPAGASIAYDKYVAEPVSFLDPDGNDAGAGMLVFEFDPAYEISHEWMIGWAGNKPQGTD